MPCREGQAEDWRDGAAYTPLLEADRSILAWEWLRRDPGYRAATRRPDGEAAGPQDWGLEAFESPDLAAPLARPLWSRHAHPWVLSAHAEAACSPADAFDLEPLAHLARIVRSACGAEHVLFSDGLRTVRLDVLAGSLPAGRLQLRYVLAGFGSAEKPLLTLRRLMAVRKTGRFSRSLHCPESRAKRWVLMLRGWDGQVAGADQREIAEVLLSRRAGEPRWRSESPSLRSQAQRLARGARAMAAGGYRELLS